MQDLSEVSLRPTRSDLTDQVSALIDVALGIDRILRQRQRLELATQPVADAALYGKEPAGCAAQVTEK